MNKLDLNKYQHDPFSQSGNGSSYLVKNFIDEIADFDAGASAKFQHSSIQVVPQSTLSNIFNGSQQQLDYQLNNDLDICHFDQICLNPTISNTGPGIATPLASHFLIDYIEVMLGGSTIETIYAHHLLYNELYIQESDDQVRNNRAVRAYNGGLQGTNYTNATNLAVGVSRSFFIEIPCVFTRTKAFIAAIDKTIVFRVHFVANPLASTSAATTLTLTSCDMLISGKEYNDIIKNKLFTRYRTYDHVMPYYDPQRAIISGQNISSTTKTQVKITEFGGMASSQIVVFLVPSGATREQLYQFNELLKVAIYRNGKTVSSFQDQPALWVKQQMAQLFNTTAAFTEFIYVIPQSCYPLESVEYGIQRGQVFMTNNDIIEIQATVAGVYDVYVLCYRFCNATITKQGGFLLQPIVN